MSSLELDKCLDLLRYVKEGDYVLSSDINVPIDCIKTIRNWLLNICNMYNIDPKYVYELDPYIAKLEYVKSGDIILPDHHNTIVDTLKKLREVLEKIEGLVYNEGYQEGYASGYSEGYVVGYREATAYGTITSRSISIQRDIKVPSDIDRSISIQRDIKLSDISIRTMSISMSWEIT